jgi:hypothetical protein
MVSRPGIPCLTWELLSGGYRQGRPWCKCAGILMHRMLIQGDDFICKICGRTEPIKKDPTKYDWNMLNS